MANRVGQAFGNYQLLRLLGQGRFAEVYLGEHVHLETQVAIKVLHGQVESRDREGFLAEARTLARLRHPHIVRVLDFGLQEATPFLVLDYAPGGSLRTLHPRGTRLPLATVVSYVQQVASALQYAHDQHVIHRDLKPENLLVGHHHEVLLSDFGIAVLVQTAHSQQQAHEVAGTAFYMAPEVLRGHPCLASDQYALGILVYEWLSGEYPFAGTLTEVTVKQALAPPPALCEQVPGLPAAVEQVVFQALSKDPQQRFAHVWDFALALEAASGSQGSGRTIAMPSLQQPAEPRQTSTDTLPTFLTPLIGREQEVAAVCAELARPEVRLLTLVGTGGIGKTRLSLEVARAMQTHFADGVSFVPLAPIRDPTLVLPTIAQVLGIRENAAQPPFVQLREALRTRHLLLLLDNVEQVVVVAPQLEELLASCSGLKLLVTSRALLHLAAEHVLPVPPLALPDPSRLPEQERLGESAAVALFVARTRAVQPSFQLTAANARAVAEICVRLDGLPLAIELAAARIRLLPPQALLARLSQRLAVLTGGARSLPERQQTLRNTLKWSYDLLEEEEQQLFRRLSVFVGGWTLEAAEALAEAGLPPDQSRLSVLDGVASLLDKSLLLQVEQEGEPRLQMLQTVREYALECLTGSREEEVTRRAHADYFMALALAAEPELKGPQQSTWLERLEQERDNLRAALAWFLERGEVESSREMALRLAGALWEFWNVHGLISEARTELSRALAGSEGAAALVRAKAISAAADLAYLQSDDDGAEALSQESLALYREIGDTQGIATSLTLLARVAVRKSGNFAAARTLIEEGLGLYREVGNKDAIAWSLVFLADIVSMQGEYSRGHALLEESLAMFRELGNKRGLANALKQSALWLFIAQRDQASVHDRLEESLALFRELSAKDGMAFYYWVSGWIALSQGDPATAHTLLEQSLALWREIGNRWFTALSLGISGKVAVHQGDLLAARAFHEESLAIARASRDKWLTALCLEELAIVGTAQAETGWAARLWGAAEALRDTIGFPLLPVFRVDYERSVSAARLQLGEKAFAAAWAEGRTMTVEQVFAAQGQPLMTTAPPTIPTAPAAPAKPAVTYPDELTEREVEVLRLVAQGLTDVQVADQLVISPRTVNGHLRSIYSKIGVTSRSAATRYALDHHLA